MKLRKYLLFGGMCSICAVVFVVAGVVIVRSINAPQAPWQLDTSWKVPVEMSQGVVFAELNGDGLPDILQSYYVRFSEQPLVRGAWINTGSGWKEDTRWLPPNGLYFRVNPPEYIQYGVSAVDLNGDGLSDLVKADDNGRVVYLNTGVGWKNVTEQWIKGWDIGIKINERVVDQALRFQDLNGDGLVDIIKTLQSPPGGPFDTWVYLNRGTGSE